MPECAASMRDFFFARKCDLFLSKHAGMHIAVQVGQEQVTRP